MALLPVNHRPSKKDLLVFGLGLPVLVGLLGLQRFAAGSVLAGAIIWGVGLGISLVFAAVPPARRLIYVGWMYTFFPIAFAVSHLVLGAVYFLAVTPISLLLRAFGKDPMNRELDQTASSYWVKREPARDKTRYFRQF